MKAEYFCELYKAMIHIATCLLSTRKILPSQTVQEPPGSVVRSLSDLKKKTLKSMWGGNVSKHLQLPTYVLNGLNISLTAIKNSYMYR
jgi:hypothetical protein